MFSYDEHDGIKIGKDKEKLGKKSKAKIGVYLGSILIASFILFRVLIWASDIEIITDMDYQANKQEYIYDAKATYYRLPNANYQIKIPNNNE